MQVGNSPLEERTKVKGLLKKAFIILDEGIDKVELEILLY